MKKIVAIMPIKTNNERLPGKNTLQLGEKPLLQYELDSLIEVGLKEIYVFCSNEEIEEYLPKEVKFLKRPECLDASNANFTQIFECFMNLVDADIYVYAHATAPFIKTETMEECIRKVYEGDYDSAFCATKIQDYLWKDGIPINFDATNIPRSQDLDVIYRETSGVYVFTKEVFKNYRRRIGINPFIKEVSVKEAVDINNREDYELAKALVNIDL